MAQTLYLRNLVSEAWTLSAATSSTAIRTGCLFLGSRLLHSFICYSESLTPAWLIFHWIRDINRSVQEFSKYTVRDKQSLWKLLKVHLCISCMWHVKVHMIWFNYMCPDHVMKNRQIIDHLQKAVTSVWWQSILNGKTFGSIAFRVSVRQ